MNIETHARDIIAAALAGDHIRYEVNKFYSWLMSDKGRPMQLDVYLPDYGVAIEVDGVQHYRFPNRYHKSIEEFNAQKRRDSLKDEQCKVAGIEMIRVRGRMLDGLFYGTAKNAKRLSRETELKKKIYPLPAFNKNDTAQYNSRTLTKFFLELMSFSRKHLRAKRY